MADAYKRLAQVSSAAVGPTTIYTATGVTAIVKKIILANNSGAAGTIKLHHVESGGSADTTTVILPTTSMGNNEHGADDAPFVMEAGDFLQMEADGTHAITVQVYGLEVS